MSDSENENSLPPRGYESGPLEGESLHASRSSTNFDQEEAIKRF